MRSSKIYSFTLEDEDYYSNYKWHKRNTTTQSLEIKGRNHMLTMKV